MPKRTVTGIVVADNMQKTCVVEVVRLAKHPRYLRRVRVHKKYKAHDEKNEYHLGDKVVIEETRPLSRDKRWKIIGKA